MKLGAVFNLYNNKVMDSLLTGKLPAVTAYKVVKNHQKLVTVLQSIDKVKEQLLEESREKPEGREYFIDQFRQLLEQEEEIEIDPIKVDELGSLNIEPLQLLFLLEIGILE